MTTGLAVRLNIAALHSQLHSTSSGLQLVRWQMYGAKAWQPSIARPAAPVLEPCCPCRVPDCLPPAGCLQQAASTPMPAHELLRGGPSRLCSAPC